MADINFESTSDQTPLMSAAWNGQLEMVNLLISLDADLDYQSTKGNSALGMVHWSPVCPQLRVNQASWKGHSPVVAALLDADADPMLDNADGNTPLIQAAVGGQVSYVWPSCVLIIFR